VQAVARSRTPTVFSSRIKPIRKESTVIDKSKSGLASIQDRRLRVDVLSIHAQSTIRADGTPAAQAQPLQFDLLRQVGRY